MTPIRTRAAAVVLVLVFLAVVSAALLTASCAADRSPDVRMRFVDLFPAAEKRSSYPLQQAFSVSDVALSGLTRRAILARAPSRLVWTVDVPPGASLSGSIGLRPEAWYGVGDGVVFKIAVSIGTEYIQLYSVRVHPRRRPTDRRWVPFEISLAQYAGRHANLVFETGSSPPDGPVDASNDLAVWGEPVLLVRGR